MDLKVARTIFKGSLILPQHLSIPDSPTPLLSTVPFSEAILKVPSTRLMLLPVATEWTLLELLRAFETNGGSIVRLSAVVTIPSSILHEKLTAGWHLMYVDAHPYTASKICSDALKIVEEAPVKARHANAVMTVWFMMNCISLQKRVNPGDFTSPFPPSQFTSSVLPSGRYLDITFGSPVLQLGTCYDGYRPSQDQGCAAEILPTE